MMHNPNFLPKNIQRQIPGTPAYLEEERKRRVKSKVLLANQDLQRKVKKIQKEVSANTFKELIKKHSKNTNSSLIYPLSYRNNYEEQQVLYDSTVFYLELLMAIDKKVRFDISLQRNVLIYDCNMLNTSKLDLLETELHHNKLI